jgi:photoactive yellow protein
VTQGVHTVKAGENVSPVKPFLLPELTVDGLASAEVGAVELDDDGALVFANKAACDFLASREPGDPFFTLAAPWASTGVFLGRFRKGVDDDEMDVIFPYVITFNRSPLSILVWLYRDPQTRKNWVFLRKD